MVNLSLQIPWIAGTLNECKMLDMLASVGFVSRLFLGYMCDECFCGNISLNLICIHEYGMYDLSRAETAAVGITHDFDTYAQEVKI